MASEIKVDTISEKTSANGVTIDGVSLKDSKIATANSVDSDAYVDGSIDAVHLSANSVDSDAYVDGSIDTAHIDALQVTGAKLNTDVISAQTELAAEPADTDEFMVSDAGVLKRIDYSLIKGGANTPSFGATFSDTQTVTDGVDTKIEFDTEIFDTDSAYDPSTNYRFTVPAGEGGKYHIIGTIFVHSGQDNTHFASLGIYKNGASWRAVWHNYYTNYIAGSGISISEIMDLSATDYIELYAINNTADGEDGSLGGGSPGVTVSFFGGYKLL